MRSPCLFFASSTKMTGLPILRGFLLQTLTAYAPASPAPMTITGMASPRLPEMRSFEHTRQIIRLPPTAIVAISAIRISTPRKSPSVRNWFNASVTPQAIALNRHSRATSRTPA